MRRLGPDTIPRFLATGASPPALDSQPGIWRASFILRSITPILGGGVESFQPDTVDIVRTPAIRGQLRWWWRALFQIWEGVSDSAAVDRLFCEEARLWGGVGLPGEAGENDPESPGCRSRVQISKKILGSGEIAPAGLHELDDRGRPRTMPRWNIGRQLGYALFPLQRSKEERDRWTRREAMPTRDCRNQLRFRLELVLAGASPGAGPDAAEVVQVLAAFWAWIFFGGLGARTRRGFGALELSEPPTLESFQGLDTRIWAGLFEGPSESRLLEWLQTFQRAASPRGGAWPFEILAGNLFQDASQAHREIVDRMRHFRQEPGFARDSGNPRPGQSRWPEPHLLRTLAPPGGPFAHSPAADMAGRVKTGEVGAPRAAFGLPIQVQFKDQADKRADATLLPPGAGRWPSPLLLRPLRSASGKYWPAAVILPFLPPEKVEVKYGTNGSTAPEAPVLRHAGARDPIAGLLRTNHGNALQAFAEWLVRERSYRRISLPKPGGNPHA